MMIISEKGCYYFHKILCWIFIFLCGQRCLRKPCLCWLLCSHQMYVYFTHVIKKYWNNGLSCLVWLWQWSKASRFYFLREKTMQCWLLVTNRALSTKAILSGKMILAGPERAYVTLHRNLMLKVKARSRHACTTRLACRRSRICAY